MKMEFHLECYPCLLELVLKICRLAALNPAQSQELMREALRSMNDSAHPFSPPVLTGKLFGYAHQHFFPLCTSFDPYHSIKQRSTQLALSLYSHFEKRIAAAPDPLTTALKLAAAGNIIDFGATHRESIDIEKELAAFETLPFSHFHSNQMRTPLCTARHLLLLADNAGEIVLDRLLLATIRHLNPSVRCTCAVRGSPVLNDATLPDALQAGIDAEGEVVSSGSRYPGTVLDETTDDFRDRFARADIIISKGQGNYETLAQQRDPRLFFILRVKCACVARMIGSPLGSLVLINCCDVGQPCRTDSLCGEAIA